jgi:hypothetical protein
MSSLNVFHVHAKKHRFLLHYSDESSARARASWLRGRIVKDLEYVILDRSAWRTQEQWSAQPNYWNLEVSRCYHLRWSSVGPHYSYNLCACVASRMRTTCPLEYDGRVRWPWPQTLLIPYGLCRFWEVEWLSFGGCFRTSRNMELDVPTTLLIELSIHSAIPESSRWILTVSRNLENLNVVA